MITLWAIAAGVFLVLEAISMAMTTIWFCAGSVAALIAALCGAAVWLQTVLFLAVSAACFVFLYPRLKNLLRRGGQPTNADMLIGQECSVTEAIDALNDRGSVYIAGKTWSARSAGGESIPAGQTVRVEAIQGVKLIVSPVTAAVHN